LQLLLNFALLLIELVLSLLLLLQLLFQLLLPQRLLITAAMPASSSAMRARSVTVPPATGSASHRCFQFWLRSKKPTSCSS